MKKLSKLKLHNVTILNDQEMKCVTGGYEDPYGSKSSWCAEDERLFQCYIHFTSRYGYNPESSHSLGAVCAIYQGEALLASLRNLASWDIGPYQVTCT